MLVATGDVKSIVISRRSDEIIDDGSSHLGSATASSAHLGSAKTSLIGFAHRPSRYSASPRPAAVHSAHD